MGNFRSGHCFKTPSTTPNNYGKDIGQSEVHNRRTAQYFAHINKEKIYLRTDLTADNEAWVSPRIKGISLQEYYEYIGEMVKAKAGKTVTVRGCTPIKEGVVVCKADTTMEQLQRYGQSCRWG